MKSIIVIAISILMMVPIVAIVSSCDENNLLPIPGGTSGDRPKVVMQTRRTKCASEASDKCDGDQCDQDTSYCRYYDGTTNNDCSKACNDLFSGDSRKECLRYKPGIIFDIEEMVENGALNRPTEDNLSEVDEQLLCILLDIDPDPWLEQIEDYSRTRSETTLHWVVDENISSYFTSDDDQKEIMEQLFASLGGDERVTSLNIFEGFKRDVSVDDDDDEDIPAIYYFSENDGSDDSEAFRFVHEFTLVDEVCKKSNRPTANIAGSTDVRTCGSGDNSPCYGKETDTSVSGRVTQEEAEDEFNLQACILGVYCHIADGHEDAEDLRETVADILNESDVVDFIEADVIDGGLGIEDDADDWPDTACTALQDYWNNNKSSGVSSVLNLNLGNPDL